MRFSRTITRTWNKAKNKARYQPQSEAMRRRRFWLTQALHLFIGSFIVVFGTAQYVYAYEGDHYAWTYYLAVHVGFTERQAFQIASATYAIDWDPDTGPMEANYKDVLWGSDRGRALAPEQQEAFRKAWDNLNAGNINLDQYNEVLAEIRDDPAHHLPIPHADSPVDPLASLDYAHRYVWWWAVGFETPDHLDPSKNNIRNAWSNFHAFAEGDYVSSGRTLLDRALRSWEGDLCVIPEYRKHPVCHDPDLQSGLPGDGNRGDSSATYTPQSAEIALVEEVERLRRDRMEELWELGLREGNIGPYLHYMQDYYSHNEYDNVRGHSLVGHSPDFLSYRPSRARAMTLKTVEKLREYLEILGGTPRPMDWDRIWKTLDELIAVNPATSSVAGIAGFLVGTLSQATLADLPQTLSDFLIKDPTGPNLSRAIAVVRRVIDDEKQSDVLPSFVEDLGGDAWLPQRWLQYGFDSQGHVQETKNAFEIEDLQLKIEKAELETNGIRPARGYREKYEVPLVVEYGISGMKPLPFLNPLPVIEQCQVDDFENRGNWRDVEQDGTYRIEKLLYLSPRELDEGKTWTCTIHPYGLEPRTVEVQARAEALQVTKGTLKTAPATEATTQ